MDLNLHKQKIKPKFEGNAKNKRAPTPVHDTKFLPIKNSGRGEKENLRDTSLFPELREPVFDFSLKGLTACMQFFTVSPCAAWISCSGIPLCNKSYTVVRTYE